ncbi:MAG TPA: DEAD/DEAH box helicase [Desulfonatronum sp.]|nr:DEAD/DEAH box helicase [Desulfonatronum sp.]
MNTPSRVAAFLQGLKTSPRLPGQSLVYHGVLPVRQALFAQEDQRWPVSIQNSLGFMGISKLYVHQAQAMEMIRAGKDTVVATPTASGKSLIYNLPVLECLLQDSAAHALYLFPLKALAQDQFVGLRDLVQAWPKDTRPDLAVYDGDTETRERAKIRRNPPRILITNPDMLHLGLLAHHHLWRNFFQGLKYVVIDEAHVYRGVMGSHMAWVFRRLERLCAHYQTRPSFVFCSATIHNPLELTRDLTGREARLVKENAAPRGRKHFVFIDAAEGPALTALMLLEEALQRGLRTIIYTGSRKMTELLGIWSGHRLKEYKSRIAVYRAGFLPSERRRIEADLSSGRTQAVITTSALELGIDIGDLDLCLLVGYPGSVIATWQRAGRVGRGGQESAVVLLGHENPLDKFFMRHPEVFFNSPPESAVLNPMNPVIMSQHLVCAAADLPLRADEPLLQIEDVHQCVELLVQRKKLLAVGDGREYVCPDQNPHHEVFLRGSGKSLPIFHSETGEQIGIMDWHRVFTETHPGAVYLHQGKTYLVERLDLDLGQVFARPVKVDYFTRIRTNKTTCILKTIATKPIWKTLISLGRLEVTQRYPAFERRALRGHKLLSVEPLDLPPQVFETEGLWLDIPEKARLAVESNKEHFMGGIHALEHACIGILPLLILTDRNDLGGVSTPFHEQVQGAAVFVYDGIPGGIGLTRQAFARAEEMLNRTMQAVSGCECETGCPACVHSPKCGSGNRPIDKQAALTVLREMLGNKGKQNARGQGTVSSSISAHTASTDHKLRGVGPVPGQSGPKRFAVLDVETRRSAQEVGGWNKAEDMGVSCAVLWDQKRGVFEDYLQEDLPAMAERLAGFDLVVGFNLLGFDYRVLRGCLEFDFFALPTLDILKVVHDRLGYRLSLDHLARHTLGIQKSGQGLDALRWWKAGRMDQIIAYCRDDVAITRDLYLHGRDKGHLLFQNKARKLVRLPVDWSG